MDKVTLKVMSHSCKMADVTDQEVSRKHFFFAYLFCLETFDYRYLFLYWSNLIKFYIDTTYILLFLLCYIASTQETLLPWLSLNYWTSYCSGRRHFQEKATTTIYGCCLFHPANKREVILFTLLKNYIYFILKSESGM